jgi:predicted nucleotidyltransferase
VTAFGKLSERDSRLILEVLESFQGLEKAVLFGSRAKGNARTASDVDIATWGLGANEAERLAMCLDELPMPYRFDVVPYETIENTELREHIDRVGVVLMEKGQLTVC